MGDAPPMYGNFNRENGQPGTMDWGVGHLHIKTLTRTSPIQRIARLWTVAQSATRLQSPADAGCGANFSGANSMEFRSLGAPNLGPMDSNFNIFCHG